MCERDFGVAKLAMSFGLAGGSQIFDAWIRWAIPQACPEEFSCFLLNKNCPAASHDPRATAAAKPPQSRGEWMFIASGCSEKRNDPLGKPGAFVNYFGRC